MHFLLIGTLLYTIIDSVGLVGIQTSFLFSSFSNIKQDTHRACLFKGGAVFID